jgi:hypothetical protein
MKKYSIDAPYVISQFSQHCNIKSKLLSLIDSADYENLKYDTVETDISKSDWSFSRDITRSWVSEIVNPLITDVKAVYSFMGYDTVLLKELWFQQYQEGSKHGWHVHGSTFTNIYYLELPNGTPKTQIVNPFNQQEIIELDVKEGDIVSFPSFIIHRAPKNNSTLRKTIVSFNLDVDYPESSYNKMLGK